MMDNTGPVVALFLVLIGIGLLISFLATNRGKASTSTKKKKAGTPASSGSSSDTTTLTPLDNFFIELVFWRGPIIWTLVLGTLAWFGYLSLYYQSDAFASAMAEDRRARAEEILASVGFTDRNGDGDYSENWNTTGDARFPFSLYVLESPDDVIEVDFRNLWTCWYSPQAQPIRVDYYHAPDGWIGWQVSDPIDPVAGPPSLKMAFNGLDPDEDERVSYPIDIYVIRLTPEELTLWNDENEPPDCRTSVVKKAIFDTIR